VIETLVNRARPYVYTTATPPLLAHTLIAALEIVAGEQWRRDHLARLVGVLRAGLERSAWRMLPSNTAIQPVMVGDNRKALELAERLAERGLLVPAIRPPTVPPGTARLRVTLSATHQLEDVERFAQALCELA